MAMALQIATFLQQYIYASQHAIKKDQNALRIGILSTAMINPAALIRPAESHGGIIVSAIASRDINNAKETAHKYGIPHAFGSYEELLAEPGIDAVYISLPNGMHAAWATKALNAGKHVLLEKPVTANADEARAIAGLAEEKGLVLVEAFHWQFHPASHAVKDLVADHKFGKIIRTWARMTSPAGSIPKSDIRWQWDLAGGSLMDMTYVISATRYFLGAGAAKEVVYATARPLQEDNRIDEAMDALLKFEVDAGQVVQSHIWTDMNRANVGFLIPRVWELPSIEIETEHAIIYYYNFMMPHLYHYITIYDKRTKITTTQKHYSGGPLWGTRGEKWWSTYRYQLEAFVDKVRGKQPVHWVTLESSIAQMETIDAVYEKSGLGKRQGHE
ncbi:hypothetical protein JAAARDRAFT_191996 [Jaapia argillacea MUCL 33604]|uniref:D-xylose 1-dehydrogenase (NADP(+), D-xylono-1,5-lactone-forming) n=1 Tax=Jaapia argillacea MUCL 33604 TaxID=933084 RepID=A0A067Q030_9AGAM|nr:hypothetical protein JAAARDRAFT_191996 [Jaapia argillacea MUCL 33604]